MTRSAIGARAGLALALLAGSPALADVKAADSGGLTVATTLTIAGPPAKVYAALINPGRWWNPDHSWSKDGANLRLDPVVGGCFCETLPSPKGPMRQGEVEHMRVIFVIPGELIRLRGALGPFQAMAVTGTLSWELKAVAGGTALSQTYTLGGYMPGGGQAFAPVVDQVMSDQLARLKAYVERAR